MSIDRDVLLIILALIATLASTFSAYMTGRRNALSAGSQDLRAAQSRNDALKHYVGKLMFHDIVTKDDLTVICFDLLNAPVENITTSTTKSAQAASIIFALNNAEKLHLVFKYLYKAHPELFDLV